MLKCGITGYDGNLGKKFLQINNKFKYIKFKGDITKKKQIYNWIAKNNFDILIHFAAIVPTVLVNKNYKKAKDVNVTGTKHLVDGLIKYKKNLKWFFFASTSHVYKFSYKKISENNSLEPISKYGKTKLLAENYIIKKLSNSNIKFCIGRIFSIFDNRDESFFVPSLLRKLKINSEKIFLKNLNHYRDFVSTEQISKTIFFLWQKKFEGIINIGSGKKTNLKNIAKIFAFKVNKKVFFENNKSTCLISNISKLKKLGFKQKELNFVKFFNKI